MTKKKIQEERETGRSDLVAKLIQAEQEINILQTQLDERQIFRYKLIGALEYHDKLFPPKEN